MRIKKSETTFNVYLTPHFEKYQDQDQETNDIMHATWSFGNRLKAKGYTVAYMMGPVAIYETATLMAGVYLFDGKDHVEDFIKHHPQDRVYFLFKKLPDCLHFASMDKKAIEEARKTVAGSKIDNEKEHVS